MALEILVGSLFRNSVKRGELDRFRQQWEEAARLPRSRPLSFRLILVEGDSDDGTWDRLVRWCDSDLPPNLVIEPVKKDLGNEEVGSIITSERLANLASLQNETLKSWRGENYYFYVDSDLIWRRDTIDRLLWFSGDVVAPMVFHLGTNVFYDVWGYRQGTEIVSPDWPPGSFDWYPPYHSCVNPEAPFEVDTVGSCFLAEREVIESGASYTTEDGIVGFCKEATARGKRIWVNPRVRIEHPLPDTFRREAAHDKRFSW